MFLTLKDNSLVFLELDSFSGFVFLAGFDFAFLPLLLELELLVSFVLLSDSSSIFV